MITTVRWWGLPCLALALAGALTSGCMQELGGAPDAPASGLETRAGALGDDEGFEVWVLDQTGTAGRLVVFDGEALNDDAASAVPEIHDLSATVGPLCLAQTGTSPTRAHIVTMSPGGDWAILSYVGTGHVVFVEAASRTATTCIDVGAQAHMATPTADGRYVVVANQNGKLLQRIATDYATGTFTLEAAATLDLAACVTPNGVACEAAGIRPDNAPICPIVDASSRLAFVTLRGGGLFVVDVTTTPMRIVSEYDQSTISNTGCGSVETRGRMFVNAGAGGANTSQHTLYAFDLAGFPASGFTAVNSPAPETLFDLAGPGHDGHALSVPGSAGGRYVWSADRFENTIYVYDAVADAVLSPFSVVDLDLSADPAPDLTAMAPGGGHAYVALRGDCPLTANIGSVGNAVGSTPGVLVVQILQGGATGRPAGLAPISLPVPEGFACGSRLGATAYDRADPHGIAVRRR